jgi:hypothetical protein
LLIENLFCSLGAIFGGRYSVAAAIGWSTQWGLFYLLFQLWQPDGFSYLAGVDIGCNWNLYDITMFPLLVF